MIIIIDGLNRERFGDVLDEMFQLRARVFGDRLGWDVTIRNGREFDKFDLLDPVYVVGLDKAGHVVSCVRALQTTGPHMLADVFSDILDGEPPLRSATLWESTRFCVDTERLAPDGNMKAVSQATCELMIGSLEFARRSGIEDIVTVIDPVINRVLRRSENAPYAYVGSAKPMGKVTAMAALLDCTQERIDRVRAFAGIGHDLLLSDDEARALVDLRKAAEYTDLPDRVGGVMRKPTQEDVAQYCRELVGAAADPQELEAVYRLMEALAGTGVLTQSAFVARDRGPHLPN
jgi:N-acyl-L-homoserine lactone synthetase